jgi:hypothetical protein
MKNRLAARGHHGIGSMRKAQCRFGRWRETGRWADRRNFSLAEVAFSIYATVDSAMRYLETVRENA